MFAEPLRCAVNSLNTAALNPQRRFLSPVIIIACRILKILFCSAGLYNSFVFLLVYNESFPIPIQFAQFLQKRWRQQILFFISISKFRHFQNSDTARSYWWPPCFVIMSYRKPQISTRLRLFPKGQIFQQFCWLVCETLISLNFYKPEHLQVYSNLSLSDADSISDYIEWNIGLSLCDELAGFWKDM